MQYTGVRTPWSSYSYIVARAVQRMYAVYDANSCPGTDCGMNGADVAEFFERLGNRNNNQRMNNTNLVRDPNFANFMGGPWGRNVLYGHYGIWWNSRNARTTAQSVNIAGGETFQRPFVSLIILEEPLMFMARQPKESMYNGEERIR